MRIFQPKIIGFTVLVLVVVAGTVVFWPTKTASVTESKNSKSTPNVLKLLLQEQPSEEKQRIKSINSDQSNIVQIAETNQKAEESNQIASLPESRDNSRTDLNRIKQDFRRQMDTQHPGNPKVKKSKRLRRGIYRGYHKPSDINAEDKEIDTSKQ